MDTKDTLLPPQKETVTPGTYKTAIRRLQEFSRQPVDKITTIPQLSQEVFSLHKYLRIIVNAFGKRGSQEEDDLYPDQPRVEVKTSMHELLRIVQNELSTNVTAIRLDENRNEKPQLTIAFPSTAFLDLQRDPSLRTVSAFAIDHRTNPKIYAYPATDEQPEHIREYARIAREVVLQVLEVIPPTLPAPDTPRD